MDCVHLLDNVKFDGDLIVKSEVTKELECSECGAKEQNWLCLHCGVVGCGRYVNGHAKQHADSSDHQLCLSCDVYSVYCYKCDDYISNDTEQGAIDSIRQNVMNNRKIDLEYECDIQNDISCNNDLENISNVEADIKREDLDDSRNLSEDIPRAISCTESNYVKEEDGENKIVKNNKNSEEPARSLRPRSRKRSHSEDSSKSSENTSQPRNKEKKSLSCNGKTQNKKVVGLKNLGNTCFMNAVLQSLSNIQEFSCYFSQLPTLELKTNGKKVYHSRSYTRQEMHDVVMAEELRKVLINLRCGGCGKGAISPECLFLVIWKVVPRFRGYQQQDAHEFLRYMLDRLHTELQQLLPPERGSVGPHAPSIVTAVFGGTLQSEVRCLGCGSESKKLDPFLDLSLELPEAGCALADCLASFVKVEELSESERYLCASCSRRARSTKQFRVRRLPNVLCLHLKRFRWHNYFRTKLDTPISFPLRSLDMSEFVLSNVPDTRRSGLSNYLYDLAAVIVHHGTGAGSGHYTAFAINEEQWFHFNDQSVRVAEPEAVASCKPYILFYIRREFSLPAPPLALS